MKILCPLSAGKDSQATLLYCIEQYGVENITAVFCDTKWEHEITYTHLDYLVTITGVELVILSSEKYDGFADMVQKKKRFPSSQARFCTEELKVKPMIDYVLSLNEDVWIYQGIRSDESESRSNMRPECSFFRFYYEPYASNEITIEKFSKKPPTTHRQKQQLKKAKERLTAGKNDEKYHTYRKDDVFLWKAMYSEKVYRPFFYTTANEVIEYSITRDVAINPLYYWGASRVGCFPCIYISHPEMLIIIEKSPETIDKIEYWENKTGSTFFRPDYIPNRYHTGFDPKSGKSICYIRDVVRYLKDKTVQTNFLPELNMERSCASNYIICE